jgi:predicted dehydrogenase
VRNGRLGNLKKVETHLPASTPGGPYPELPVPEGLDWAKWLGPAPKTEYVKERTHGSFRWWREYSGGMMTDWGAHHNDIAQWALGMDNAGPIAVEGKGEKPNPIGKNCYNTYPRFLVTYTYPGNIPVHCSSEGENGVLFEGENGWIFVSRGVIRASDQKLLDEPLHSGATKLYVSNHHMGNFVDCMRSREQAICTAEIGHRSVTVCHLGNLAMDLGKRMEWDPKKERFTNDRDANKLLKPPYRSPWAV